MHATMQNTLALLTSQPLILSSHCVQLQHAAANGHVTVVRYLLKHGADPRALGSLDETAMHLAACSGNSEICVLLYMAAPEVRFRSCAEQHRMRCNLALCLAAAVVVCSLHSLRAERCSFGARQEVARQGVL